MATLQNDARLNGQLIELLSARLCHDLISPVSAINNGVELITEMGEDPGGEALALVGASAGDAARKLQFFRLAFGSARLPNGASAGLAEARAALSGFPVGERIAVTWTDLPGSPAPREATKLVLLLALVALDCLGGSGEVNVTAAATSDGMRIDVMAAGPRAGVDGDMLAALGDSGVVAALSPKTAPAAYAAVLAHGIGSRIAVMSNAGEVRLSCLVPFSAPLSA